jgi:hypothetical protein
MRRERVLVWSVGLLADGKAELFKIMLRRRARGLPIIFTCHATAVHRLPPPVQRAPLRGAGAAAAAAPLLPGLRRIHRPSAGLSTAPATPMRIPSSSCISPAVRVAQLSPQSSRANSFMQEQAQRGALTLF